MAGAVPGALLANPLTGFLLKMAPNLAGRRPEVDATADWRVLLFIAAVTIATVLVFGLIPALHATRSGLAAAVKQFHASAGKQFFRKALVAAEVALCAVLLTAAGLFARRLQTTQTRNLGFIPDNIVLVGLNPALSGYTEPRVRAFYEQLLDRVRALPGVKSAGLASIVPGSGFAIAMDMRPEGYSPKRGESSMATLNWITPGYLQAMRIPLVSGRDLTAADRMGNLRVAIVNQSFADRYWPGQVAIGKRLNRRGPDDPGIQIVGVIPDQQDPGSRTSPRFRVYLPATQWPCGRFSMTLHVRAAEIIEPLIRSVRAQITGLDGTLPILDIRTMEGQLRETISTERLMAQLSAVFAGLALLLAALGIYGIVAYGVTQQTREIGIRIAVGAGSSRILGLALGETAGLFAAGLAAGIPGAWGASKVAASMIPGVKPGSPAVFAAVAGVLALAALVAALIPARRAVRIDPAAALRHE